MLSGIFGLSTLAKPSTWALKPASSSHSFAPSDKWSNADMDPVPAGKRTWTAWNYTVRKKKSIAGSFSLKASSGLLDFRRHERSWYAGILSWLYVGSSSL